MSSAKAAVAKAPSVWPSGGCWRRGRFASAGDILVDGRSVFALDDDALRTLRAEELGFVFQDPIGTLDPTRRIGLQVKAALPGRATDHEVEAVLFGVGLSDAGRVARSYPHELSGGMAQRVSIGMALARRPKIVIADEPTAALDASIKSQILDLLTGRCRATGAVLILLSHDLHAIRKYSDRVAVMYGGRLVETGPSRHHLHTTGPSLHCDAAASVHRRCPYRRTSRADPGRAARPGRALRALLVRAAMRVD